MEWFSYLDKREVLQKEYSQPPILPSPYFRWVVNIYNNTFIDHRESLLTHRSYTVYNTTTLQYYIHRRVQILEVVVHTII